MKLPSISYLAKRSKESFLRFPFPILSALASTIASIYFIQFNSVIDNPFPYISIILTTGLGISLYLCTAIFGIRHNFSRSQNALITAGATAVLVAVYFSLPDIETTHNTLVPYIRYTIISVIVHLLVAFAPYARDQNIDEFWNYNKMLFIRFWLAILYSGFLCVGSIIALTVIEKLFLIDIKLEIYFQIFTFITGFFNTWFFVAGIPKSLDELVDIKNLSKGLKIFTQYILLPLLIIYLIILYVYSAKIVIEWVWPTGIIGYLITFVSILGIFAHCLIYPYSNLSQNDWIKKFIRLYYYLLYPLIILLFIAIAFRINEYGVTINRYIVAALGVWLSVVAFYFSIGKTNIKFIPISLAVALTIISVGPWSVFSISKQSQLSRLTKILEENNILINGKINNEVVWATDQLPKFEAKNENADGNKVSSSTLSEVNSIMNYLDEHHGLVSVQPFFQQNLDSLITVALADDKEISEAEVYLKTMGLRYINKFGDSGYAMYSSNKPKVIKTTGYDYLITIERNNYSFQNEAAFINIGDKKYRLDYTHKTSRNLMFMMEKDTTIFKLDSMSRALKDKFGNTPNIDVPEGTMVIHESSPHFDMKLQVDFLRVEAANDATTFIDGLLFLTKKEK